MKFHLPMPSSFNTKTIIEGIKGRLKFIVTVVLLGGVCFLCFYNPGIKQYVVDKTNKIVKKSGFQHRFGKVVKDVKLIRKFVDIGEMEIYTVSAGESSKRTVIFLHAHIYSSAIWEDIDTLQALSENGYHVIAVDLPNHGKTNRVGKSGNVMDTMRFMTKLLSTLNITKPVIVSPSYSGIFSVRFVLQHSDKILGYVPIAPMIGESYTPVVQDFKECTVPTLIVYGENDIGADVKNKYLHFMPNSEIEMIPNGSHYCYVEYPEIFHKLLIKFLNKLDWANKNNVTLKQVHN